MKLSSSELLALFEIEDSLEGYWRKPKTMKKLEEKGLVIRKNNVSPYFLTKEGHEILINGRIKYGIHYED